MVSRKCPACRSASVDRSNIHIGGAGIFHIGYVCKECGAAFAEIYEYSHTEEERLVQVSSGNGGSKNGV